MSYNTIFSSCAIQLVWFGCFLRRWGSSWLHNVRSLCLLHLGCRVYCKKFNYVRFHGPIYVINNQHSYNNTQIHDLQWRMWQNFM